MFDKLIVSEPETANFKNRRNYFILTSILVGLFFSAAVVISIYAADYRMGTTDFELVELIAPPSLAPTEPEPPKQLQQARPQQVAAPSKSMSVVPTRKSNMARVDEPTKVPTTTSVVPNDSAARPLTGSYEIRNYDSDPGKSGVTRETGGNDNGASGLVATTAPQVTKPDPIPEPPPVKSTPVRPPPTKSMGVINGLAKSLPKPVYPAPALAIRAEGKVDVRVTIDETGKVIAANAVSGNALLRSAAVAAAWKAKFTPTYLSDVAVKVTGVIVYNFSRS